MAKRANRPASLGSIIIPAHNEAQVIGRSLEALAPVLAEGVDVVVVANGCSDDTADVVRRSAPEVTVVETDVPCKANAIRLGERAAPALPRLYVDADVVLTSTAGLATLATLREGAVAARPPLKYEASGATWPVRRYFRARSGMPSLHKHAWGAGVYGLSEQARSRFGDFPDVIGDDLWVDRLLSPGELVVVDTDPVIVRTPRDSRSLLNVLRRGQRAKADPNAAPPSFSSKGRTAGTELSTARDLADLALRSPQGAGDAQTFAAFAVAARLSRKKRRTVPWERDESSR